MPGQIAMELPDLVLWLRDPSQHLGFGARSAAADMLEHLGGLQERFEAEVESQVLAETERMRELLGQMTSMAITMHGDPRTQASHGCEVCEAILEAADLAWPGKT